MKKSFHAIITAVVFVILICGFVANSLWIEKVLYNNLCKQAYNNNLSIAKSILAMVKKTSDHTRLKNEFISHLQTTCDYLQLPNIGHISLIDSNGRVLAEPGLTSKENKHISKYKFSNTDNEGISFENFFEEDTIKAFCHNTDINESYLLSAVTYQNYDCKLIIHQKTSFIRKQAKEAAFPFLIIGIIFGAFLAALAGFITYRQTKKYNNQLNEQKKILEDNNREISINNEKLQLKNQELNDMAQDKDGLINILAHDLKNPIGGIESSVKFLFNTIDLDEDQAIFVDIITLQINQAKTLISDVLDMNSFENNKSALKKTEVDMVEFVLEKEKEFRAAAEKKNIKINVEAESNHIYCLTGATELHRITENLLSNAVKYTLHDRQIILRLKEFDERISIQFIDQGPGIPEEEKHLLFKKFSRLSTKPTGDESTTGLGLYIVKLLADKLEAKVNVESSDKGSIFTVIIPK
ncbi:MAG: HAMP domain-containing histidine kinase [Marinifilaceae bacterium]|jgi:signal transduction histidine kinase|nr:HAMP domain-containing histidine kinase [Marinifilaceae bacterium]